MYVNLIEATLIYSMDINLRREYYLKDGFWSPLQDDDEDVRYPVVEVFELVNNLLQYVPSIVRVEKWKDVAVTINWINSGTSEELLRKDLENICIVINSGHPLESTGDAFYKEGHLILPPLCPLLGMRHSDISFGIGQE